MTTERLKDYLDRHAGLLRWKAGGDEELVQEAIIEVWRKLEAKPDATDSYLDQAATWRINAVRRGESLTGERRPRGGRVDALRVERAELPADDDASLSVDAQASDLAAHEQEIHSAIEDLPEAHRDYVVLRFWGDLDRNEIGRRIGRNAANLATTWRTQIQPTLADRLSHLEDAA